jgi:hypothetical protein
MVFAPRAAASVLVLAGLLLGLVVEPTWAQGVGQVKVSSGTAHLQRDGQRLPALVGTVVRQSDVVVTGSDGSVGIVFADGSRLSVGPDSVLAIDRFTFDSTTHAGVFESTLRQGTLSAVSGKIAKQSPAAMKVKTPVAILGVRGTEFMVRTRVTEDGAPPVPEHPRR